MIAAAILLGGCGGAADSTSSTQAETPHAVQLEHSSGNASDSGSAKGHKQASSQPKQHSPQKPRQAAKPRSAAPSHPTSPAKQTEDAVAKVKELVGGGGGKQRTVSNPKQVHKVLQELQDQSGSQTSGSQESDSGGSSSGSPSGVEEILESLGGD